MISTKLFQACQAWAKRAGRSVEITIDSHIPDNNKIWAWDYTLMCGVFVEKTEDLPTAEKLVEEKRKKLAAEMEALTA